MAGKESTDLSAGVKFERETEAHKERLAEVAEGTLLAQVIPPLPSCSHFLGHISPNFYPFFPFFARFHRLDEAVPTSPKPEPRAKKQPARPRGGSSTRALSAYGRNHLA